MIKTIKTKDVPGMLDNAEFIVGLSHFDSDMAGLNHYGYLFGTSDDSDYRMDILIAKVQDFLHGSMPSEMSLIVLEPSSHELLMEEINPIHDMFSHTDCMLSWGIYRTNSTQLGVVCVPDSNFRDRRNPVLRFLSWLTGLVTAPFLTEKAQTLR